MLWWDFDCKFVFLSLSVFLGVLFVCDTELTGCEITLHSLFVCLFVCMLVCMLVCLIFFAFCLFVCAYWRLWIVSGGCSVWQMRMLEDIIKRDIDDCSPLLGNILVRTRIFKAQLCRSFSLLWAKKGNISGDIDVGKSWPFFLSKFGEELGSEMWSWLGDQTEKFEGKDSRSSYRSFNSALESERR